MGYVKGSETLFGFMGATGGGIVECDTLPTEKIKTDTLYKIPAGLFWYDGSWHQLVVNTDIVVPAKGSRGNAGFVESVPGLVKLYNESAGITVDSHNQLGIAAASNSDIDTGTSMKKPIVPGNFVYAAQANSYRNDLSDITASHASANTPAGALAIKDYVLKNALNFKLHKIPRGGTFEITPGMMALILPYGDYTLSAHKSDGTEVATKMGATIVMATDWGAEAEDANCYWAAFMYVKSATIMPTMASNHTKYTSNCYIKNNDSGTSGTGYAYVYYVSKDE